jgi:hypothetical protein
MNSTKKKIIIIASVLVAFWLVIIVISIFLINNDILNQHDPVDDSVPETALFINRYQLDYSIGAHSSSVVLTNVKEVILDPEERKTAPHKNIPIDNTPNDSYASTIIETSFARLLNQPEHTFSFLLEISDGREYEIYVRTDLAFGQDYIVTVMHRLDIESTTGFLYVNAKNESELNIFADWADTSLHLSNLKAHFAEL